MEARIEEIRNKLYHLTQEEYSNNGYIANKTEAKPLVDKIKEKEAEIEINKFKGKMNQIIQKKEQKKNISYDKDPSIEKKSEIESSFMDNTSDQFNIVYDDIEYLEWRKIPIDEKLEILEKYFESDPLFTIQQIPLDNVIQNNLRGLVSINKILYKKDLIYDKINKKILSIPLIKYIDEKFVLKDDEKKINIKKQNLNNINKLFKLK